MNKDKIRSIFPILVFAIGAAIQSIIILFNYDTNSIEVRLVLILILTLLTVGYYLLYLKKDLCSSYEYF